MSISLPPEKVKRGADLGKICEALAFAEALRGAIYEALRI